MNTKRSPTSLSHSCLYRYRDTMGYSLVCRLIHYSVENGTASNNDRLIYQGLLTNQLGFDPEDQQVSKM